MHDELHTAAIVEKALKDDVVARRHDAHRLVLDTDIPHYLLRRGRRQADLLKLASRVAATLDPADNVSPERGDLIRELRCARGRLAQPEGYRGRQAVSVFYTHHARLDAADAPGGSTEEDDVARHTLDSKVFVQGTDEGTVRLRQHAVVGHVRYGAAALDRDHARAALPAQHAVDAVSVQVGRRPSHANDDAFAHHLNDLVEVAALQIGVRRGLAHQVVQIVLAPGLAGALGDDLLSENIERRDRRKHAVQPAGPYRAQKSGALHQLVARGREEAAFRRQAQRVAGAPNALEEGGDATGRFQLADQVHYADVDTKFERSRRHQRLQIARLQSLLQALPSLLREAAVVRGDVLFAQPLRQIVRRPLSQPAGVDEDQRRAMLLDQRGEPVVDVAPLLARADRLEIGRRYLDRDIEVTLVAGVDDRAVRRFAPNQETSRLLDRSDRGGEADARRPLSADVIESREREREVAAPLVADQGVDLVHDHRLRAAQHLTASLSGEHQIERLRRRDEDMGRPPHDLLSLLRGRIAGAHHRSDVRASVAHLQRDLRDLLKRLL